MNIILSLDYEVFFGARAGSVAKNLIEPTDAIIEIARSKGVRLCFFVDAGFLIRLRESARLEARLEKDYSSIRRQLDAAIQNGHEIQLHVHPHWEDSQWSTDGWIINTNRYRLHDFGQDEMAEIICRYHSELVKIAGPDHVVAFRAGGWVIQPFNAISDVLLGLGICIDSTVFPGGLANSQTHRFDFRGAPNLSRWRFQNDPLTPVSTGEFLELPIASHRLNPLFFWQLAWTKKFGGKRYEKWGDGQPLPPGKTDLIGKLSGSSMSVVSIDGLKASFLEAAYKDYQAREMMDFVIIGHPKMFSPFSSEKLNQFLECHKHDNFVGYREYMRFLSA